MSVPAANAPPDSAYDEHAHVAVGLGRVAGLDQRVVHVPRQRVARLGTIQGHDSDGSVDVPGDVARWHSGSRCDPGDGRAVLRDVTGGHGRARDQSRAARRRLDAQPWPAPAATTAPRSTPSTAASSASSSISISRAGPRASSSASPAPPTSSIENYRPGVMARLGLDYDALTAREPAAHLRVDLGARTDRARGRRRAASI